MNLIFIVAAIILVLFFAMRSSNSQQPELPENITEEDVKDLMREGKKIQAIKCYRAMTGLGLKDAKEAVEKMEL